MFFYRTTIGTDYWFCFRYAPVHRLHLQNRFLHYQIHTRISCSTATRGNNSISDLKAISKALSRYLINIYLHVKNTFHFGSGTTFSICYATVCQFPLQNHYSPTSFTLTRLLGASQEHPRNISQETPVSQSHFQDLTRSLPGLYT